MLFLREKEDNKLEDLMKLIRRWCSESESPVVLMINEVDSATNNQVFLDFLAQLRDGYISRETEDIPAFQSVIFAGVTEYYAFGVQNPPGRGSQGQQSVEHSGGFRY